MKLTSLTTAGVQWNNTSAQLPDASTSPSRGYGSTTSQSVSNADESNSSGTGYRKIDYSSTSAPDSDGGYIEIPVVGLNTPFFSIVHGVALGSLATTVLVSFSLLVYLFTYGRRRKVRQQMKEMHAATSQPRRNRPPAGSGPRTEWKTAESPIDGGGDFGGQISGPKTTPARVR